MGDFLLPAALKIIAEYYQQGLLDRPNVHIKGAGLSHIIIAQIIILTTSDENQTLAFNYVNLALNNSFFLHHLMHIQPPSQKPILTPHQKPPKPPTEP
ncbi:hypothetical protein V8E53_000921 [Lactarius tabidus]